MLCVLLLLHRKGYLCVGSIHQICFVFLLILIMLSLCLLFSITVVEKNIVIINVLYQWRITFCIYFGL